MEVKTKSKTKKWIKPRHAFVRNAAFLVVGGYTRLRYGVRVEKFRRKKGQAYLILFNHQTAADQFFVGMTFNWPIYYVASEDLFSNGFISKLLRWAVAPVPIKKQTTDINAVMNCIRIAREGGTIAIAPEGNRTYSGRTVYMNDAVAALAKKLKLPIALVRIEGGYGVQPRWSDVIRRGKNRVYVSRVVEPEEYKEMSNEQLYQLIQQELYVNEAVVDGCYRSSKRAEYLERAMYVCPYCGLSEFESHGNEIRCKKCDRKIRYGVDKTLSGVGFDFPYQFVDGWYQYQESFVNGLDLTAMTDAPLYEDQAAMSEVIVYKHKVPLRKQAKLVLYGDRLEVDPGTEQELVIPFADAMAFTVLGRNKLNVYYGQNLYQFKGDKRFNALKYVNLFHRHRNIIRGNSDDQFLGL